MVKDMREFANKVLSDVHRGGSDMERVISSMDDPPVDKARRRERFWADLVHQANENRFHDYGGPVARRRGSVLVEVQKSELPEFYALAAKDVADAMHKESS